MLNTLVTIGCPFDLIRTYFQSYFTQRTAIAGDSTSVVPVRWINIYSPLDVFGSNFRDDDQPDALPEKGVVLSQPSKSIRMPDKSISFNSGIPAGQKMGVLEFLALLGFKAHGFYWSRNDEPSVDCFRDVVPGF